MHGMRIARGPHIWRQLDTEAAGHGAIPVAGDPTGIVTTGLVPQLEGVQEVVDDAHHGAVDAVARCRCDGHDHAAWMGVPSDATTSTRRSRSSSMSLSRWTRWMESRLV